MSIETVKQNDHVTPWNDCVLNAHFFSGKMPSWEEFYEARKNDNHLLVNFAFNKLSLIENKKAKRLIKEQIIYKKRLSGIEADMNKLGCATTEEYIYQTNLMMLEIKCFYNSCLKELGTNNEAYSFNN